MDDPFIHHERRSSVRSDICIDYSLVIGDQVFKGITGNMSLGGVYLQEIEPRMPESLSSATGILTLEIPDSPVKVDCRIAYVGAEDSKFPPGVGVAFCNPNETTLSIIRQFLSHLPYQFQWGFP